MYKRGAHPTGIDTSARLRLGEMGSHLLLRGPATLPEDNLAKGLSMHGLDRILK